MTITWESPVTEVVWESQTAPGVEWRTVIGGAGGGAVDSVDGRTGTVTLADLYATLAQGVKADSALQTIAGIGAGGALSGTYPSPGLNVEAVQDLVAAFIVAGLGINLVYDDEAETLTFSAGVLPLSVLFHFPVDLTAIPGLPPIPGLLRVGFWRQVNPAENGWYLYDGAGGVTGPRHEFCTVAAATTNGGLEVVAATNVYDVDNLPDWNGAEDLAPYINQDSDLVPVRGPESHFVITEDGTTAKLRGAPGSLQDTMSTLLSWWSMDDYRVDGAATKQLGVQGAVVSAYPDGDDGNAVMGPHAGLPRITAVEHQSDTGTFTVTNLAGDGVAFETVLAPFQRALILPDQAAFRRWDMLPDIQAGDAGKVPVAQGVGEGYILEPIGAGAVTADDVGLGNVDNTADSAKGMMTRPYKSGLLYGPRRGATGTVSFVANFWRCVPFRPHASNTFDQIRFYSTLTASGKARLAIFDSDGTDGYAKTLIVDAGEVSTATAAGDRWATISELLTVGHMVWLGCNFNATTVTTHMMRAGYEDIDTWGVPAPISSGLPPLFGCYQAGTYGAAPAELSSVTPYDNSLPWLTLRSA